MGKLLCDSTAAVADTPTKLLWQDPISDPLHKFSSIDQLLTNDGTPAVNEDDAWENVWGLEEQQKRNLQRLHAKGVLWKHPEDNKSGSSRSVVFRLAHGGEVSSDGNCLFTSTEKATRSALDGRELRRRTVRRFLEDFGSASESESELIDDAIRHMYSPDLKSGWGIHVVQEIKLLAKKEDRESLDSSVDELVQFGMQR